jgi:hypothetical protein
MGCAMVDIVVQREPNISEKHISTIFGVEE